MNWKYVLILILLSFGKFLNAQKLVDQKATKETAALYVNLKISAEKGIMFGHQDDDAYGVGWFDQPGRSDVKEVCGSYPAVHGWDLGKMEYKRTRDLDSVSFEHMHGWIKNTYERGGVNTISWHVDNPVSGKSAWDKTPAVRAVLPGGEAHEKFKGWLDNVAEYLKQCQSEATSIPIIFRPWHEHNGDWFWWGKGNCSEEDYIKLWRFTVDYLQNQKGLHHLIYAFSPDRSRMNMEDAKKSYLYGYPGDEYVDIIGLDNYHDVGRSDNPANAAKRREELIKSLRTISDLAKEKGKVAALTETGQESVKNPKWFTEVILDPLLQNRDIQLAYFLVWRNYKTTHHYAPYKGHSASGDFTLFANNKYVLMESNLQHLYEEGKFVIKK